MILFAPGCLEACSSASRLWTEAELSRGQGPLAPPVEAKLWIADQCFGAAKERGAAVNAGGYRGGTSQLGSNIICHSVFRIIKPSPCPMAWGARLQTPNDRKTAEVPPPQ